VASDTRRRMVAGAAEAIGTHGVAAMSLRDLAREAGVPLGSTYHHFPGGKGQLVEEAVTATGRQVSRVLEKTRDEGVEVALRSFATHWRDLLVRTDFATGCPVLAVATARSGAEPALQEIARGVFAQWQEGMAAVLVDDGIPEQRAASLARLVISSLEGAVAVARVERSADPLDEVVAELSALLAAART
jgi:AcrR family transcriptional regulator